MKIINYEKNEMIPLTNEENEYYERQKVCYINNKKFNADKNDENAFKLYHNGRDHCHYTENLEELLIVFVIQDSKHQKIPAVFHNDSTYEYHFIINQLAKEFDGQLECQGENTEKYISFSVPIKKELDNSKTITYKLKFIDSFRFMVTLPSSLFDSFRFMSTLPSEIYNKKCIDKNCTSECQLIELKHNKLQYKCYECKKKYS